MALVATTTADDQVITLGAGTYTGHVLVLHNNCSLVGAGSGRTFIRADGTYDTFFRATDNRQSFTVRGVTLDCRHRTDLAAAIEVNQHLPVFTAVDVGVYDTARVTVCVDQRGDFTGRSLQFVGLGAGVSHRPSTFGTPVTTTIDQWVQTGGLYALTDTTGGRIRISNASIRLDYFALPTYEAVTATAYTATYVDVVSQVEADRVLYDILRHLAPVMTFDSARTLRSPLVRLRDRIETADAWTQIMAFGPDGAAVLDTWRALGTWTPGAATGTATVYRCSYGVNVGTVGNRFYLQTPSGAPRSPRWRYWNGATAPVPQLVAGSRLDIVRHGINNRDTDTGAFHFTEDSTDAQLTNVSVVGGGSDMITFRGVGGVGDSCSTDLGYDMGFTLDALAGRMTLRECQANRSGRTGFHLTQGPSDLYRCGAYDNGTINDGSGDFGLTATGITGATLQVVGSGNLDGLSPPDVPTIPWASNSRTYRRRRWQVWR